MEQKRVLNRYVPTAIFIAVCIAVFFTALFAPFSYYSNEESLHIIQVEDDEEENVKIYVYQNARVPQSLLRVFSAVGAMSDATVLNAAADGLITDELEYKTARERYNRLSETRQKIYLETVDQAKKMGIAEDSDEFREMLIGNLSGMDLLALDLLEAARVSDNSSAYAAIFNGIAIALVGGIIDIFLMLIALVAFTFGILDMVLTNPRYKHPLFMRLFCILSGVLFCTCIFNPIILPTGAPLALACIGFAFYFVLGAVKSVTSGGQKIMFAKDITVAALSVIGLMCLAVIPSLSLRISGLNGFYAFYPGTVGTVYFSHLATELTTTAAVPHGAIVCAYLLGISVCALTVLCTVKALDRLYSGGKENDPVFFAALFAAALTALALIVSVSAISASLIANGRKVAYVVGAGWYVNTVCMFLGGMAVAVYGAVCNKLKEAAKTADGENGGDIKEGNAFQNDTAESGDNTVTASENGDGNTTEEVSITDGEK